VVIVAGGGYTVAHVLSAGNSGTSASSSGAAPSHNAASRPHAAGLAPEVPSPGVTGALPLVASGTHYRPGQLPAQVGAVLKRYPVPESPPSRARAAPPVGAAAFPYLPACVARLARGARPLLVDIAHYGTHPAAVIVVPAGAGELHVWVVGPGCPAHGGDILAHVSMPVPG
jgi:hypothetical protein